MVENTFGFLDLPIRDGKPRKSGLSFLIGKDGKAS